MHYIAVHYIAVYFVECAVVDTAIVFIFVKEEDTLKEKRNTLQYRWKYIMTTILDGCILYIFHIGDMTPVCAYNIYMLYITRIS